MYKQPKPILRQTQYLDLKSMINREIERYMEHPASYPFQNCLNCMNWDNKNDQCGKYNVKPPAEIIINSCPEYVDGMEIPF